MILSLRTVEWKNNSVIMIDQTKLPNVLEYVTYTDFNQVAEAIRTLVVRGAPAIGVSGAFGLALSALQSTATKKDDLISYMENAKKILFETRPTAVNLAWGLDKIMDVAPQTVSFFRLKYGIITGRPLSLVSFWFWFLSSASVKEFTPRLSRLLSLNLRGEIISKRLWR